MTPDQKVALWVAGLTALPTIVFTGAVAYWNWRRDQERLIVMKSPLYWQTPTGAETDATLCGVGIVVINLSLYPVRVAGLALLLDGKTFFEFYKPAHDELSWPPEIPGHARMIVRSTEQEWNQILFALEERGKAAVSKFVAVAVTETGRRFASNRLKFRILRPLRAARSWLKRRTIRNSK